MPLQFVDARMGYPQKVELVPAWYESGGIALHLYTVPDENDAYPFPEPWCRVTVNIPGAYLPEGAVFIKDYAENEGLSRLLVRAGVIHDGPVTYAKAGFGLVEAYRLTPLALECIAQTETGLAIRKAKQTAAMAM